MNITIDVQIEWEVWRRRTLVARSSKLRTVRLNILRTEDGRVVSESGAVSSIGLVVSIMQSTQSFVKNNAPALTEQILPAEFPSLVREARPTVMRVNPRIRARLPSYSLSKPLANLWYPSSNLR